jgi:hypothetical protein
MNGHRPHAASAQTVSLAGPPLPKPAVKRATAGVSARDAPAAELELALAERRKDEKFKTTIDIQEFARAPTLSEWMRRVGKAHFPATPVV